MCHLRSRHFLYVFFLLLFARVSLTLLHLHFLLWYYLSQGFDGQLKSYMAIFLLICLSVFRLVHILQYCIQKGFDYLYLNSILIHQLFNLLLLELEILTASSRKNFLYNISLIIVNVCTLHFAATTLWNFLELLCKSELLMRL